jgi:hypothetical protein
MQSFHEASLELIKIFKPANGRFFKLLRRKVRSDGLQEQPGALKIDGRLQFNFALSL